MSETALVVLEKELKGQDIVTRISASLGKPMTDPAVMRHINGAMMYIKSKIGTKGDVSHCSKQSIIDSLINAATVGLPVDNKHYACLVAYGSTCNFQPEWRGYVAKVKEADASVVVIPGIVYKDDKFEWSREDGTAHYKHTPANACDDDPKNIVCAYCFIKSDSGNSIEVMSKKELEAVRASSKMASGYIWNSWPLEMYKKTIVRRACKIKFTEAVAELDALDNKMFQERPEKIAPTIADSAPLPEEHKNAIEAEVVTDAPTPATPPPPASAFEPVKESAPAEAPPAEASDLETIDGIVEKHYSPRGNGPHEWKIGGRIYQLFAKSLDGIDNLPIILRIEALNKEGKSVKVTFRSESYMKDGVKIPVNRIVNAYSTEEK